MKSRRIIAVSMALAMTAGMFAGCGKKGADTRPEDTAKTGQTQNEPLKIRMLANLPTDFPQENNQIVQEVEKRANVKLDLVIPPANNFVEKRNLMLASGEPFDIVTFVNKADTQYTNGVKQGTFIDVKKYIEKAENIKKYVPAVTLQYVTNDDGTMTAIPGTTLMRSDGYMVRKDWMDKLGIKQVPTTIEGLYDMFKAFAKQDPDGNGKDDTYALSANNGSIYWIDKLAPIWGAGMGWQEDSNGNLYHTDFRGEGYKEALKFGLKLMKEGIVDPEIIANKTADEKWRSGKIGAYMGYSGWLAKERDLIKKSVPDADLTYMQIPNTKDGKAVHMALSSTGHYMVYAITSNAKDPEGIVKFFDATLGDDVWNLMVNGIEGVHYNVKDNKKEFTPEFTKYNVWRSSFAFLRRPDIDFYVPKDISNADAEIISDFMKKSAENVTVDKSIGHQTPSMVEMAKAADWTKKKQEVVNKIIYGQAPLEAWDQYVKEYKEAGYDKVEKEMNEWYQQSVKGKK